MTTKISLIFYIRKSKINANGQVPIYQRITIEGKRYEISTGQFVEEAKWSSEAGRVKGNSEEARSINNRLDMVKSKVFDVERRLFMSNTQINFENFKNEYLGKKERERTLIPIFIEHNRKIKELVGSEYALGTLERYETSLKHTKAFLQWKYNISDIDITKIDHAFITEYEFYLRTERKCANNTAVKYIKNFHKIINICLANGWLIKDPFANYKSKVKEVIREFLTEQEIQEIMNKEFVTERLEQIRDIFVFSCFTGLAYIDVKQLTNNNIVLGIDGDKWINKNRQKTDTNSKIPLLPTAQYILDKYAEHPVCLNEGNLLPVPSNQKMNAYLKEIADVCGIKKDLTFHMARHTFATTVTLSNGVPIETVSKMLGHTNLKTTQHYAKILDKKISEDMQVLKSKFSNNLQTSSKSVNY
ncbi:site-specific integrase [Flavobacterium haoranii]|uniref:Site-specific recombinase XerD n=2 Tax=Flavobacterium haoranii TaxID=683124 RepID=A0A1M6C1S3_9FLAO|nr:site-specific integrase [Flavobacterium haoranii]SHI54976.1 Site-specific recombinase XerD [Flavobacterium haoranii]